MYTSDMFALVDCNNFYASCERAFDPTLNGKPVAILSNNDGCVIARSNEVKPYVPMGVPAFKYRDIFEQYDVKVYSSNYALYGDMSNRVMNTLSKYTPDIEIYSIDEAFLQFVAFDRFDLRSHIEQMKADVLQNTRIPISVGVAPTKALSKIANKIGKKFSNQLNGIHIIDSEALRIKALKWTKIGDVWGVGERIGQRLKSIGIHTAYAFTELPDEYVRKEFSVVGLRLKQELQGIPTLQLDEVKSKKAIATTRSFKYDLSELDDIRERIATFAVSCAEKLRKQRSHTNLVSIFVRSNGFKDDPQYRNSITLKLPYPTNSSITIAKYAILGLKKIYRPGYKYKKAGVIVMGITPEDCTQVNLFENENPKHTALMQTIDSINKREGSHLVKLSCQDPKRTWIMRQERLSKRYTTRWDELLTVK